MTPQAQEELNNAARLQQMKINTRLTALQCAQTLMSTPGYGTDENGIQTPNKVDHITLLAMAGDIEKYILGGLEEEAKAAIEEAKKPPRPNIIQARP